MTLNEERSLGLSDALSCSGAQDLGVCTGAIFKAVNAFRIFEKNC